jgi:hypothetical protein
MSSVNKSNSVQHSPSLEVNSCLASQEITRLLWTRMFFYRIYESQLVIRIQNQTNLLHRFTIYYFKISFNINFTSMRMSSKWPFFFILPTKMLCALYICPMPATSLHHSISFIFSSHWRTMKCINYMWLLFLQLHFLASFLLRPKICVI